MQRIEPLLAALTDPVTRQRLVIAAEAALAAGRVLTAKYGTALQIRNKGEIDLVTEADLAAEETIVRHISEQDPDSLLLAEESQKRYNVLAEAALWIIDPLDGTTNFAHGFPWFAVSIAFACRGESRIGIVYAPLQNELFAAALGAGAWLNGRKIQVSGAPSLNESLLATGFPYDVRQHPEPVLGALTALISTCQGLRRAGAAALDLAYVACGRLDGFWEIKLKPWDTAAGCLLVAEAGGISTNFRGHAHSPVMNEIAASNGRIHDELLVRLEPFHGA